ncbi:MAG: HRDC domain-containing protein [Elusimicrobia bacterium]|nr:HRDC domain-containing protein [Elusimicrobiota bacterium]
MLKTLGVVFFCFLLSFATGCSTIPKNKQTSVIRAQVEASAPEPNPELLARLQYWHSQQKYRRLPFTPAFPLQALHKVAINQPSSIHDLSAIDGVGRQHAKKYGFEILEIIEGFKKNEIPPWLKPAGEKPHWTKGFRLATDALPYPSAKMPHPSVNKINLGIADLQRVDVQEKESLMVLDFLRAAFVNTGLFRVTDRASMSRVLAEQKFQIAVCTTDDCAVNLGRLLKMDKMAYGTVSKIKNTYHLAVNVVDIETAEIQASRSVQAGSMDELGAATVYLADMISGEFK